VYTAQGFALIGLGDKYEGFVTYVVWSKERFELREVSVQIQSTCLRHQQWQQTSECNGLPLQG
jgi:hypothetical protein